MYLRATGAMFPNFLVRQELSDPFVMPTKLLTLPSLIEARGRRS
jgi:hypothetical protein